MEAFLGGCVENGLNTDCFIVGLPHSPLGNLQMGNLYNSEIIWIILSVSPQPVLPTGGFLWAPRMLLSGRWEVVGRVCVRLGLHFRTVLLSSGSRQLFPGCIVLGIISSSQTSS